MSRNLLPQGAEVVPNGVRYRIWAPEHRESSVEIYDSEGKGIRRVVPMVDDLLGSHHALDERGHSGDLYKIRLSDGQSYPCPMSRWQPLGVNGPSQVIDPSIYEWTQHPWERPLFRDLVIYELHVGTFTPAGTFRGAIEKLAHLRELGVNAIEIMPVAEFPGERNWGYDGVLLFAPARIYGHPDDFRALVDAAHAHGIAVILDVVYNHFGPDGNYLRQFSPSYFEHKHHTPWGEAINFGREHSGPVRAFFVSNVLYWMEEFHIDGFRLDATHEIYDDSLRHILEELAETVHQRGGYIIGEDERNEARLVASKREGGFGLDAVWADDFHHALEVAAIDASIYKDDYAGDLREIVDLLQHGWVYRGKLYKKRGKLRGTACEHLAPERFVYCISNHDQVGNRAHGERLNHMVSLETYRAASALLCLIPYTPLFFMGQEWASSTPFLYFTDHGPELGRLVEEGRRREFEWIFKLAAASGRTEELASPQAAETFARSKLDWEESRTGAHAQCMALYRELLRLRRNHAAFRPPDRRGTQIAELGFGVLALRAREGQDDWLVICDLRGAHCGSLARECFCALAPRQRWQFILSTNEPRFGGPEQISYEEGSGEIAFEHPEVLILKASA